MKNWMGWLYELHAAHVLPKYAPPEKREDAGAWQGLIRRLRSLVTRLHGGTADVL